MSHSPVVRLREVTPDDLGTLFAFHRDPAANRMAAFTVQDPEDRDAFLEWWGRLLGDDSVAKRTIVVDDAVVGSVVSWLDAGRREVAYWLGREHWGRGYATAALRLLIAEVVSPPLRARVAKDNIASLRVLEKCGFVPIGEDRGFANARGEEIDEYVLELA